MFYQRNACRSLKRTSAGVLREIRQKFKLGHDVFRHTYVSMLVGAFRSVGDASLQAGSETIIRSHYLDLKTMAEGEAFWRVIPAGTQLPKKMEKKDGRFILPKGKSWKREKQSQEKLQEDRIEDFMVLLFGVVGSSFMFLHGDVDKSNVRISSDKC